MKFRNAIPAKMFSIGSQIEMVSGMKLTTMPVTESLREELLALASDNFEEGILSSILVQIWKSVLVLYDILMIFL